MDDLDNLREYVSDRNDGSQNLETFLLNNMDAVESIIKFVNKNKLPLILAGFALLNSGFLPQILNSFGAFSGLGGFRGGYQGGYGGFRDEYYRSGNFGYNSNLLPNLLSIFFNGGFNNFSKFNNFANLLKS